MIRSQSDRSAKNVLTRFAKLFALPIAILLFVIQSSDFETNAEALRDQTRLSDTYASKLYGLNNYFRSGVGDPSSLASQLATLEAQHDSNGIAAFRLRVAAAILSDDPQEIEKLSQEAVNYPVSREALETQKNKTDAYTAINAIWLACFAHQKLEAAYYAANLLCERIPEARYPKRLRLLALIHQGKVREAGGDLASLLDSDVKSFGLTYQYKFDDGDLAQNFWSAPFRQCTVPLCQEVRGLPLSFNVTFDLPEVELWLEHAATKQDQLQELSEQQSNQQGWKYLLARMQLHQALAQDDAQAAQSALEAITSFFDKPDSNWLMHYLNMQSSIHFGDDINTILTAFAKLRTRLWPNLRNIAQAPAGVVYREGITQASQALSHWALKVVDKSSDDQISANIKRFASSFYPFGNAVGDAQTQFFALQVIDLLSRTNPERLERVRPLLREHLYPTFGQQHRPNPLSYFALEHSTRVQPETTEKALQAFEDASEWAVLINGAEHIQFPSHETSRQWLEQLRLNAQHLTLPSIMPGGWSLTFSTDINACLARAATSVISASEDQGKSELTKLKTEVEEQITEKLDAALAAAEEDDSVVGEYIWALRHFAPLHLRFVTLHNQVTEEIRSQVGEVDLKQIKRGFVYGDLAATVGLVDSDLETKSIQLGLITSVANELPQEGTLTPVEGVALGLAYTLQASLTQEQRNTIDEETLKRLEGALDQLPLWGPLGLKNLEARIKSVCGEHMELAQDTLELLTSRELRQITRLNLHLIQSSQSNYRYAVYQGATPETHWGYPKRQIEILGREHPSVALYQRSMREQMPLDYAGFHSSMNRLNAYAWALHSSYAHPEQIKRIAHYALALGGNVSEDNQREAFKLPAGAMTLESATQILDTLAWGYFDAGEIDQAIAIERYAMTLTPGDRVYALALEHFKGAKVAND